MRSAASTGLEVAHFADEHDVGVLAQSGAQGVAEALRVAVHLALIDQTALMLVHELDRIFNGEDVIVALLVDLVDHGRQRRGLTGSRRTGDQHETARPLGERGQHLRQVQILEAADLFRNQSVHRADRPALIEHVHAEASQPLDAEGEVELEGLLEPLFLCVGEHAVGELLGLRRIQVSARQSHEVSVDTHLRWCGGGDMEVRALHLHHRVQQFRQRHHFTVSLTISSIVVTPSLTLRSPLLRSVIIPSSTALRRSSSEEAPTRMSSRSSSVTSMTS
jgi:hypothetical protein